MRVFTFLLFLVILACTSEKQSEKVKGKKEPIKDGVVKTYHSNGKVRAEVPFKNGKRNGVGVEYYADGHKLLEINYVDGKNHGLTKRYYNNGTVYEETMYENDKMHGVRKKYRQNGKLSTEAPYHNDQPCLGLKEYLTDGKLKKNYPTIVIEPVDRILKDGQYILRLSLSDKNKKVTFYEGPLKNECITDDFAYREIKSTSPGIGELIFGLPPGSFIMKEITIVAKVKTPLGNYYLTQRAYNLAIENR